MPKGSIMNLECAATSDIYVWDRGGESVGKFSAHPNVRWKGKFCETGNLRFLGIQICDTL